jgi:hypothetical protein
LGVEISRLGAVGLTLRREDLEFPSISHTIEGSLWTLHAIDEELNRMIILVIVSRQEGYNSEEPRKAELKMF